MTAGAKRELWKGDYIKALEMMGLSGVPRWVQVIEQVFITGTQKESEEKQM